MRTHPLTLALVVLAAACSGDAEPTTVPQTAPGVARLIDPTTWPSDVDAEFFLWIPESDTVPRAVDGAWLDQRDPDGSIRADLDQLGELSDGSISNRDNAFLLEFRLSAAGFTVTLDEYPGGHTTSDKVPELVGYLKAATS